MTPARRHQHNFDNTCWDRTKGSCRVNSIYNGWRFETSGWTGRRSHRTYLPTLLLIVNLFGMSVLIFVMPAGAEIPIALGERVGITDPGEGQDRP